MDPARLLAAPAPAPAPAPANASAEAEPREADRCAESRQAAAFRAT